MKKDDLERYMDVAIFMVIVLVAVIVTFWLAFTYMP